MHSPHSTDTAYTISLSLSRALSFSSHSIKLPKVEVVVFPFCFLNNEKKLPYVNFWCSHTKVLQLLRLFSIWILVALSFLFASARFYLSSVHRETYARQWLQQQHICINRHLLFAKNSNNARESEREREGRKNEHSIRIFSKIARTNSPYSNGFFL